MPDLHAPTQAQPEAGEVTVGMNRRWRWPAYGLAAVVLGLVFALYVQPDMMVTLAGQLWACF